jgi:DNA polymerase III epsilon subunit-like protein
MQAKQDFIVIDTEGKNEVSEIAIIDSRGQLVYEAFTRGHPNNDEIKLKVKPLKEIVVDFFNFAHSKIVICHNVVHDLQVLKKSCAKVGISWQNLKFECSCELAKFYFHNLPSYSLEYLSKYLKLKVNKRYFNANQAHTARYDAEFTYQLYLRIMENRAKGTLLDTLRNQPNPFGSSRVDTPFQEHLDLKEIYQVEFDILKSVITDIKLEKNHQSKGVVVIGEPGTGKTHIMMRLAKELLKVNRLLFIRQPNNPDSVLYHTYSRILESFVEKVPNSNYTQLEHLLANSFVKLISSTTVMTLNRKDRDILSAVENSKLSLYEALGVEGTQRKRDYWQHIEKRTNEWWINKYGAAGYSTQIIKGIVKYCSYSDYRKKELVTRWLAANELTQEEVDSIGLNNWNEEMSKEEFSLQAISVFSKLSLLDEPLIIVFDQLEGLGLIHNRKILLSFGEAVKEIFTHVPNSLIILNLFPERWEQFKEIFDGAIVDRVSQYKIRLHRPSGEKLKEILKLKAQAVGLNIETLFSSTELANILSQNSIRALLNSAADYYRYKVKGIPLPSLPQSINKSEDRNIVQQKIKIIRDEFTKLQDIVKNIAENLEFYQDGGEKEVEPIIDSVSDPVVRYLQEQRNLLEKDYTKLRIISDSDDIGKLTTIAEAFKTIKSFEIDYLRLGKKKIPEHLVVINQAKSFAIGFLQTDGSAFTSRIKNYNELVIINRDIEFRLLRDRRQSEIKGKVGKEEIEKLNNTFNGKFVLMEKKERIDFELIYKLITDIQNGDFEINLVFALEVLISEFKNYWLIQAFLSD